MNFTKSWIRLISILTIGFFSFSVIGCGGGGGGGGLVGPTDGGSLTNAPKVTNDPKTDLKNILVASKQMNALTESGVKNIEAVLDLVDKASDPFSKPDIENIGNGITKVIADLTSAALNADSLNKLNIAVFKAGSSSLRAAALTQMMVMSTGGAPIHAIRADFGLTALAIFAGVSITGYFAARSTAKAIDKSHDTVRRLIDRSDTPAKRSAIIQTMQDHGIDINNAASAADLRKAFDAQGINLRNTLKRDIVGNAISDGDSETAADEKKTTVEVAKDLGEVAITTTVSLHTAAAGGQLMDKIVKAGMVKKGLSETTAAAFAVGTDLVVSALEMQPLDIAGRKLSVTVVSEKKEKIAVEQPSSENSGMTPDIAQTILDQAGAGNFDNVKTEALIDAVNVMINSVAKVTSETEIQIPARIHTAEISLEEDKKASHDADTENEIEALYAYKQALKIPGDFATTYDDVHVIVATENTIYEIHENVKPSAKPVIFLSGKDMTDDNIEDLLEGGEEVTDADGTTVKILDLLISANPADPGEFEDVSVTATISPATANIAIKFSVSGTDGYSNSGTPKTDANGKIHFYIPGAEDGVRDVIKVSVGTISRSYSYVF